MFPVTLTVGREPSNLDFLNDFISDLIDILDNWLIFRNKHMSVKLRSIVADAPATAIVKNIKSFSGYFGLLA